MILINTFFVRYDIFVLSQILEGWWRVILVETFDMTFEWYFSMALHGTIMGTSFGLHLNHHLVGALEHEFYIFPFHIWDVILPIDKLIFFKMVKTTNQSYSLDLRRPIKIWMWESPTNCPMKLSHHVVSTKMTWESANAMVTMTSHGWWMGWFIAVYHVRHFSGDHAMVL